MTVHRRFRDAAVDVLIAAAVLALVLGTALGRNGAAPTGAQVALTVAACCALVLRRRHPAAVLAVVLASAPATALSWSSPPTSRA